MKNLIFVVGRICAGKHTFVQQLCEKFPELFQPICNYDQIRKDNGNVCIITPDALEDVLKEIEKDSTSICGYVVIYVKASYHERKRRALTKCNMSLEDFSARNAMENDMFMTFENQAKYDMLVQTDTQNPDITMTVQLMRHT